MLSTSWKKIYLFTEGEAEHTKNIINISSYSQIIPEAAGCLVLCCDLRCFPLLEVSLLRGDASELPRSFVAHAGSSYNRTKNISFVMHPKFHEHINTEKQF